MLINNAVITGSLTVNGTDVTYITGSSQISSSFLALSSSYLITSASYVVTSGSYAITSASFAQTSGSLSIRTGNLEATSSTLTSASSSFAAQSASLSTRLTTDETNITTLTNASASFAVVSSSFSSTSGSLSTRVTNLEATSSTVSSSFSSTSGSIAGRVTLIEGQYATTGSNTFTNIQYISSSTNAAGFTTSASLYTDGGARITKDLFVSGTTYLTNLTVYGTASVQYITSSQINVGANIIYLNTQTPAVRYGGMAVADSGSNAGVTGSMLWDSVNNGWIYTRESGSNYSSGALISGPRSSVQGSEQGTLNNYITKGQGGDHITSSQIIDDGTTVQIPGNLQVTGSIIGSSTAAFSGNLTLNSGGDRIFSINDTGGNLFQIQAASNILYYSARSTGGSLAFRTDGSNDVKLAIASTGAATFSSYVKGNNFNSNAATSNTINVGQATNDPNYNFVGNDGYWGFRTDTSRGFNLDTYNSNSPKNVLNITQAGAATFSSSVTAAQLTITGSTNAIATINSTYVGGGFLQMQASGTVYGYVGCSASILSGTTNDFVIVSRAGTLELGANSARGLIFSTSNAATFSSSVTATSESFITGGDGAGKMLKFTGGTTKYNFMIAAQQNVNNALEITPSTTAGGSTFSTPAVTILSSGNVGIGTTSPAYSLDVKSSARILNDTGANSITNFYVAADKAGSSAPDPYNIGGIRSQFVDSAWLSAKTVLLGSALTGYGNPTERISFLTDGTNLITSMSGNVGIGTANPSAPLNVVLTSGGGYNPAISVSNTTITNYTQIGFAGTGRTYGVGVGNASSGLNVNDKYFIYDVTGAAVRFTIDTTGSVGIGTSSPSNKLDVIVASSNSGVSSSGIAISDGAANRTLMFLGVNTAGYTYIQSNQDNVSSKPLVLQGSGGAVLIGTTSAQSGTKLQVAGGFLDVWSSSNTLLRLNHDGTRSVIETFTSGAYGPTSINPNGGNVLIGTTTDNTTSKLQVSGNVYTNGQITACTNATTEEGYVSKSSVDTAVINLATLMPNFRWSAWVSLTIQAVTSTGTDSGIASSFINCVKNGSTNVWTYSVVSTVGYASGVTLTFGGTSAAPTVQFGGAGVTYVTANFHALAR